MAENIEKKIKNANSALAGKVFSGVIGVTGLVAAVSGSYVLYQLPHVPKEAFCNKAHEIISYVIPSVIALEGVFLMYLSNIGFSPYKKTNRKV